MTDFAEIRRLLDKVPVFRCPTPGCQEHRPEQFTVYFCIPAVVPVDHFDMATNTIVGTHATKTVQHNNDPERVILECVTCGKMNPLPGDWSFVVE